jgi:hypothetical protein
MKKYQILVSSTMLLFAMSTVMTIARAAEVIFVEGNVQVQTPADEAWKKAEVGMKVDNGDSIRTARHSKVDIAIDSEKKNTIRLGEKTLVVLNSATEGIMDRLDLSRGRVYSNMENIKAGLSFEVNTPSAIAGVRGSSYMVYAERDEDEVSAYKDTVFLKTFDADKNQIGDVVLPEGFKTFIERFSAPSALIQVSLREFERFDNIREDLSARSEGREPRRMEREQRGALEQKTALEQQAEDTATQKDVIEEVTDTKELIEERNVEQQIEDLRGEESWW